MRFAAAAPERGRAAPSCRCRPPARQERRAAWRRWAAAAAVLLAVGGLAHPGWLVQPRLRRGRPTPSRDKTSDRAGAQQADADAVARCRPAAARKRTRRLEEVRKAARDAPAQARRRRPGKPSRPAPRPTYQIQTTDLNGKPVAADRRRSSVADGTPARSAIPSRSSRRRDGKYQRHAAARPAAEARQPAHTWSCPPAARHRRRRPQVSERARPGRPGLRHPPRPPTSRCTSPARWSTSAR